MISRRQWILGAASAAVAHSAPRRPPGTLIETHVHLFADDPARFPYSPLSYKPKPNRVEDYVKFAMEVKLNHALAVHPEPYQDDHRSLEYAFTKEPFKGFFKGTCLFDPTDPATPNRIRELVRRNPGRIVALRIHEMHAAGTPSTTSGAIRDRDLKNPQVRKTLQTMHELGLALQVQCIPYYAPQIAEIGREFREMPIILDHLARPGQGTPAEYQQVLRLADLHHVFMKFSRTGVETASKQPFPHADAKPLVQRVYSAYGADHIIWGELGNNATEFAQAVQLFDTMFDSAPESDRAKMRGLTAKTLFAFA
ncbi:MAG TPA: amidohydrolase family protein [Bryobacteraceae bacterium]|nr:amidohydrolase family protein [Bryobacteraceae bacterium]